MASNTEKSYTTRLQTRLTAAITAGAVTCVVEDDLTQWAASWATGLAFYMTLVDPLANREIVKVTGISGRTLTIARGQDSSTARAWPAGSLIEQRLVAADASSFIQRAGFRTVAYNPNGVLSAAYPGEKILQDGAESCQDRWWKNVDTTRWQLIAGEACDWEFFLDGFYQGVKYYGDEEDGTLNLSNANWDTVHDAGTASGVDRDNVSYSPSVSAAKIGANYQIARGFYAFDLADEDRGLTVVAAKLFFYASDDSSEEGNSKTLILQEGLQDLAELQLTDFNEFDATVFGTVTLGAVNPAVPSLMSLSFDATGIAFINSIWGDQYLSICLREYDHDYLDVVPAASPDYGYFRLWFGNSDTYKPFIVVSFG